MSDAQFGQLLALATAVLWTGSAVAWTSAGRYVGALPISSVRLLLAGGLLLIHGWLTRGSALPTDATVRQASILGLSGFTGFFLSDLCLFKAFLVIGPRQALMVFSLVPPMAALMSWIVLGSPLSPIKWLAMLVTLAGVIWVVAEQPRTREEGRTSAEFATDQLRKRRGERLFGAALALAAAFWQAVSLLLTKIGLTDYDAAAATTLRVLGGGVGYILLISLLGRWSVIIATLRAPRVMMILTAGAVVGPYLGVICYVESLRHCHAGVVATIVATMPVLILPVSALIYNDRITLRAVCGAVVSVVGVGLLMLT